MSDDWIKMRTDLYRNPKICIIADFLMKADGKLARHIEQNNGQKMGVMRNVMRNVTVGALVTLWGVTRRQGKRVDDDLFIKYATLDVIDDISDLPGFGEAMECVGWAEQTGDGVIFPNFFCSHNVDPKEDFKEKAAERQRRFREKQRANPADFCDKKEHEIGSEIDQNSNVMRNVTGDVTSNDRERERERERDIKTTKEKIKKEKPSVVKKPDDVIDSVWIDFVKIRSSMRAPITQTGLDGIAREAMKAKISLQSALEVCCERGWRGFKADWIEGSRTDKRTESTYDRSARLKYEEAVGRRSQEAIDVESIEID
jgi:hypothetical protein